MLNSNASIVPIQEVLIYAARSKPAFDFKQLSNDYEHASPVLPISHLSSGPTNWDDDAGPSIYQALVY